ncbi:lysyl-tRNA synthetase, class 2 [Dehalogenimonas formicexedens]|uniref:Lysine--tRNA ligase n=1 Tax=Dehalogenimonas formicexedens TaxID=1839801 RepID=A0A1P8F674_9CHLR|nr:lysine--tRNA ligase [Dehalogenimonas formicexedens]APV43986.1 lysyl-tRNA synthetase, class 2 [Dehalogenimonas formicexedens]
MTSRIDNITRERLDKLARLKELGVEAYPNTFHRSHTNVEAASLAKQLDGSGNEPTVTVAGRLIARRGMGKINFFDILDGSGKIQLLCGQNHVEQGWDLLPSLDIGDFIGATGNLKLSKSGEPTVFVKTLSLLTKSLQPLPEKWHGLQDTETRFRQRYLDLISNPEVRDTFRTRARIISGIRKYLDSHNFIEVETPVLQPAAGGAAARPFITHHNALDRDFYLRIALELHLKRLIVGGFDGVYEIGRIFRNEGISFKHNPEFTMLESYQAYADYRDVMKLVEEMVSGIVKDITGSYTVKYGEHTLDFTPPWPRVDFRAELLAKSGVDFLAYSDIEALRQKMRELGIAIDPKKDKGKLLDELLSTYIEPNLVQPCFLIDYPIEMSPLAKTRPDEPRIVERFEGFAAGMEIANAFSELNDPLEQEKRFKLQILYRNTEAQLALLTGELIAEMDAQVAGMAHCDPVKVEQMAARAGALSSEIEGQAGDNPAVLKALREFREYIHEVEHKAKSLSDKIVLSLSEKLRLGQEKIKEARGEEEQETIDEDFITALEYGMPPTGGLGVGIDRLTMILTDNQTIREVIFFPALKDKE